MTAVFEMGGPIDNSMDEPYRPKAGNCFIPGLIALVVVLSVPTFALAMNPPEVQWGNGRS